MQTVTMIRTFDGQLHATEKDARKHLDKLYGDELLKHARNLAQQSYTFTSEYLNVNLEGFARLIEIKADMNLIDENND